MKRVTNEGDPSMVDDDFAWLTLKYPREWVYGRLDDEGDPFMVDDDGVWLTDTGYRDGHKNPREWVCGRLDVLALHDNSTGDPWGYLLTFTDWVGNIKHWTVTVRQLSGRGNKYWGRLLGMGFRIDLLPAHRKRFAWYIQTRKPEEFATRIFRVDGPGEALCCRPRLSTSTAPTTQP